MGGGDSPKPSSQELALQGQQAALLRAQQQYLSQAGGMLGGQADVFNSILPLLLEQSGYQEVKGKLSPGQQKELSGLQAQLKQHEALLAGTTAPGAEAARESERAKIEALQKQIKDISPKSTYKPTTAALKQRQLASDLLLRQTGYNITYDKQGKFAGFKFDPKSTAGQAQLKQKQLEQALLNRSIAAAEGRLPVDAGLTQGLRESEGALGQTLQKRLGTGFETSSAGIEALARFNTEKNIVLDAARRGDLQTAVPLAQSIGGYISDIGSRNISSVGQLSPGPFGTAFQQTPLSAYGPQTAIAQNFASLGGAFGGAAGQAGQAAGQFTQQRFQQQQFNAQQQQSTNQMIGAAGGALTSIGIASAAGLLGGTAGVGLGSGALMASGVAAALF